ncbi:acyl-CoA thioester hydrolase/BAAT C-terminal domain-containing protein [uncultured Cellulomonas sp.]|uniref:alpha/beta hydrolase family protein n=1 Tax=uncultured Cellulomonas sp. TaxID=189682 RepID=UPI0028E76F66|nr:acyl-CoA thioester hydrolase/BAAT C-terminal domain-containing protein [uncultured Cellulomonas sp.]
MGRSYRVLASTALGVVVLAIVGSLTGPQWDPVPLHDSLVVESASTAIGRAAPVETYDVRTSVVTVQLDGTTVEAQISEPVGLDGPKPGVVFVHGAGTGRFDTAFLAQARALAASGIVAMVPNKRLDTYSTRHRDYVLMAADYGASVAVLQDHPGVDPDDVGIYAESEGGWIAPVMAAQDPTISFVVLVSSPVVPPREQAAFAVDSYLRNTNVPHGVFRAIPRAVGMSFPGGGFEYADFDVTPYQRQVRQPVLVVYGTGDASMPTVQGAQQVLRDTAAAGNDDVTVRYYAGANHGIRVDGEVDLGFLRDLSGWVLGLPATGDAAPRVAGDQPEQTYVAAPVPEPRWFGDGDLVVALGIAAVGLILLGPLAVLLARGVEDATDRVRRQRGAAVAVTGPRFAPGVLPRLVALGLGAILTVVGLVWYITAVARLALDYERDDLVVQGGWLLVRVLGIAVVVVGVLLLRVCRRVRLSGGQPAPGIVRTAALWAGVAGSLVLLVVLAYWGVFQLGI